MQSHAPEITKFCESCHQPFAARQADHDRGRARFCSLSCSSSRPRKCKPPNVSCATCGKDFYKSPSKTRISKSGLHFCCRAHKDMAQRIEGLPAIHPPHYRGGVSKYRKIALKAKPHQCERCGWDLHVEVLQVHHKDRDHQNSKLTNLELLCPTCHETEHFHARDGRYQ